MAKKGTKSKGGNGDRKLSLADLWDDTDASEASNLLPAGEHEVRLNGIELKNDPKKGDAAFAEYEAVEGEYEGQKCRQMYKLRDSEGQKGPGLAYLMRDLELLGFKEVSGKDLKKVLKQIGEDQPIVTIVVKENGQYTNAYLQGSVEDAEGDGDSEGEEAEIEEGSSVTWEEDGEEKTGEVVKINSKKGTAKVTDEDGEEFTVDLDDLSLADADEGDDDGDGDGDDDDGDGDAELEEGDEVTWEDDDGDEHSGTIVKIKGEKVTVEDEDGDKVKLDLGDLTKKEEEEDEKPAKGKKGKKGKKEEPEIEVGSRVQWTDDEGDEHEGEVKKIKGDEATVVDDDDDKHKVALDELELVED